MKTYECTGELNDEVKTRLDQACGLGNPTFQHPATTESNHGHRAQAGC